MGDFSFGIVELVIIASVALLVFGVFLLVDARRGK